MYHTHMHESLISVTSTVSVSDASYAMQGSLEETIAIHLLPQHPARKIANLLNVQALNSNVNCPQIRVTAPV